MADTWSYADTVEIPDESIVGYDVEASDGAVGRVAEYSHVPGRAYVLVETGKWFGKECLVPAGAVRQINAQAGKVFLSIDKATVKDSPARDAIPHDHDTAVGGTLDGPGRLTSS